MSIALSNSHDSFLWFFDSTAAALPFLRNTQRFLLPAGVCFAVYVIALLSNWNLSRIVLNYYFG